MCLFDFPANSINCTHRTQKIVSRFFKPLRPSLLGASGTLMPHLEDFFTHGDNGTNVCLGPRASINDTVRPSPREADEAPDCSVLYVHGPEHAGQTSLLLQFGFTQVKAGKNVVLVMCGTAGMSQQPAASEIVPLSACSQCQLPLQTGNDNSLWSRLHIKYVSGG